MQFTSHRRTSPYYTFDLQISGLHIRVLIPGSPYSDTTNFSFLPHNHSRYELHFVADGRVFVHTAMIDYMAEEGDVCIVHPYEYHTFLRPEDTTPAYLANFSFYIFEDELPLGNKEMNMKLAKEILDRSYTFHDDTGRIGILFGLIAGAFRDKRPGYLPEIHALITSMMICLFQKMLASQQTGGSDPTCFFNGEREGIIEDFFLFGYMHQLTISDLSEKLHLCTRRVSELIKQLYGCTFSQKLIDTRLEIAKLMLLYSGHSVNEISRMCGFNSLNYFFTSFRKSTNQSPQQYRKTTFVPFAEHIKY